MDHAKGLALALEEARIGYEEGGIPVSNMAYISSPPLAFQK